MTTTYPPKRLPANPNLTLHYDSHYHGRAVMAKKGPFITECLEALRLTIDRTLAEYPRVFAARVDLKFPHWYGVSEEFVHNQVIQRFAASLEAKIEADRSRACRVSGRAHDTKLRYFWVREVSGRGSPHYHFAFLLNRDAYHTLGKLESERANMFHRLEEAWASALRLSLEEVRGLVHVPDNATFRLTRNEGDPGVASFFHRVSYFCKEATKVYFGRTRSFGYSRN